MPARGRTALPVAVVLGWAAPLAFAGCGPTGGAAVSERTDSIIYDDDGRREVYESPDPLRRVAALAVAAVVPKVVLIQRSSTDPVQFTSAALGDAYQLCDGQRFENQPTAAVCSAVLVDKDLVLTSAHCMAQADACEALAFVFDYYYREPELLERITGSDVFGCRRVVAQGKGELDYAFVQLDRSVGRQPVERSMDEPLAGSRSLNVVGTPSGLPLKVETGIALLAAPPSPSRIALASDTFEGSSGSGVFDADGRLFGIVARGATDYVLNDAGCRVVHNVSSADPPGGGEQAIRVDALISELCAHGFASRALCPAEPCSQDCDVDAGAADVDAAMGEPPTRADASVVARPRQAGCIVASSRPSRDWGCGEMMLGLTGLTLALRRRVAGSGTGLGSARRARST